MECTYQANSNEPCVTCPKLVTCLYICKFLQECLEEPVEPTECQIN